MFSFWNSSPVKRIFFLSDYYLLSSSVSYISKPYFVGKFWKVMWGAGGGVDIWQWRVVKAQILILEVTFSCLKFSNDQRGQLIFLRCTNLDVGNLSMMSIKSANSYHGGIIKLNIWCEAMMSTQIDILEVWHNPTFYVC